MWRRRAFREFFETPAVERAYKEAKGEPMQESMAVCRAAEGNGNFSLDNRTMFSA
jgi:hypothetical protein